MRATFRYSLVTGNALYVGNPAGQDDFCLGPCDNDEKVIDGCLKTLEELLGANSRNHMETADEDA